MCADAGGLTNRLLYPVRTQNVLVISKITWGPIYKISYDNLTIMPKLRSTYDGRLIYKTSYEGRKAFLGYDSLAKCECKIVEDNVSKLAYDTLKRNF